MSDEEYVQEIESMSSTALRDRYRVLAQLGAGGMALAHLAVVRGAAGADKLVVLKSIRPDFAGDAKAMTMFTDEARLAVQLNHQNVVQTYDVIKVDSLPVIVMEYIEGQSFSACISEGLPLVLRLRVIAEILCGLEYAHGLKGLDGTPLGIVHRDMSPQNVIITYEGHVKILDFGIAKTTAQATQTEAGVIKGKLRYMAPEQMIAKRPVDCRADLFSIGIMLWEGLAQRRLWDGSSDVEVIQTVLESGIPAPSTLARDVDPELEQMCMKAVAGEPDDRYSSALEMQEDLTRILDSRGLNPTARELAAWLESKFSGHRARVRTLIRAQLEKKHARVVEIAGEPSTAGIANMEVFALGSRTVATPFRTASHAGASSFRRWLALGGIGLVVGVGVTMALRPTSGSIAQPAVSSPNTSPIVANAELSPVPPAASEGPASAPAHPEIEVSLAATPKSARLFLDGAEIHNPYSEKRLGDGTSHTLRAEARGYVAKTVDVPFSREPVRVTLALEPQPVVGPVRRPTPAPQPPAEATSKPPAPNASHCDSVFYRDSDGIMRAKPECIK